MFPDEEKHRIRMQSGNENDTNLPLSRLAPSIDVSPPRAVL